MHNNATIGNYSVLLRIYNSFEINVVCINLYFLIVSNITKPSNTPLRVFLNVTTRTVTKFPFIYFSCNFRQDRNKNEEHISEIIAIRVVR